jgi:hypothetical protein
MAHYIAWSRERGTIKATSLQPYLLAVNGFFKDHGVEPVAQGDSLGKARRGLAASHVPRPHTHAPSFPDSRLIATPRQGYAHVADGTLGTSPFGPLYYSERVWRL